MEGFTSKSLSLTTFFTDVVMLLLALALSKRMAMKIRDHRIEKVGQFLQQSGRQEYFQSSSSSPRYYKMGEFAHGAQ